MLWGSGICLVRLLITHHISIIAGEGEWRGVSHFSLHFMECMSSLAVCHLLYVCLFFNTSYEINPTQFSPSFWKQVLLSLLCRVWPLTCWVFSRLLSDNHYNYQWIIIILNYECYIVKIFLNRSMKIETSLINKVSLNSINYFFLLQVAFCFSVNMMNKDMYNCIKFLYLFCFSLSSVLYWTRWRSCSYSSCEIANKFLKNIHSGNLYRVRVNIVLISVE